MGENITCNTQPSDRNEVDHGCTSELTRTSSDSSGLTIDTSLEHRNAPPGQSAEWTNDRHNAYLGFLEATFVKQLNRSKRSRGCSSRENMWGPFSSQALPADARNSSEQFMVLRDGCWQKIKFEENKSPFGNAADSHVIVKSPWIRRFTTASKLRTATSFDSQGQIRLCDEDTSVPCDPAESCEEHRAYSLLCHQNTAANTTEVSDQNFVDEDVGDNKPICGSMAKRSKTAALDASSNDQVVPVGKLHIPNISTASHASS